MHVDSHQGPRAGAEGEAGVTQESQHSWLLAECQGQR